MKPITKWLIDHAVPSLDAEAGVSLVRLAGAIYEAQIKCGVLPPDVAEYHQALMLVCKVAAPHTKAVRG
jgi:hypothetical protein